MNSTLVPNGSERFAILAMITLAASGEAGRGKPLWAQRGRVENQLLQLMVLAEGHLDHSRIPIFLIGAITNGVSLGCRFAVVGDVAVIGEVVGFVGFA